MKQARFAMLCLMLAPYSLAQTPGESPIMVKIMSTSLEKGTQETLELKVTNVSGSDIKAFILRLELLGAKGEIESVTNQMELEAGGPPKLHQVLSSGESLEIEWKIPFLGLHPNYHLSTDYVALVRDPSPTNSAISTLQDWGPDKSEMSERVKGMLDGLHDERTRLRQLLDTQGITALSSDLDSERAAPEAPARRSEEYRIGLQTACRLERQRLHSLLHRQGMGAVVNDFEQDR